MKLILLPLLAIAATASAQNVDFSKLRTFGTMGKEVRPLQGDTEAELFRHEGKGCLTHAWFGGAFKGVAQTRIRIYVDGETQRSIDMELYLGHGIGFGDDFAPWGTARIGKAGAPNSVYDTYLLGTYYFNKGRYATPVAGLTHFNQAENEFSAYRFHEDDPVFFQNGLRLTCRVGEKIGDRVFHDPPPTRYTTYVWLYQW
jgi:hypothetical protein